MIEQNDHHWDIVRRCTVDEQAYQLIQQMLAGYQADLRRAHLMRRYFDIAPVLLVALDGQGRIAEINQAGCELLGIEQQAATGLDWFEVALPARIRAEVRSVFERLMAGKIETLRRYQNPIVAASGEERLIDWHNTVIRGEKDNRVRIIYAAGRDITEQRRMEQQLREAEAAFRTVANFTYDWEYWELPDGALRYVSPSCERITGYRPQEFIENPALLRDITHPDDRGVWEFHHHSAEETLSMREVQFRIRCKDGELRWIEHACRPVIDDENNYLGTRVSNRDVTGRKQAELELHHTEANLRALLDSSQQLFVLIDTTYRVIDCNRPGREVAQDIWGGEIFPGANILDFVLPEDHEGFESHYRQALRGQTVNVEKVVAGQTRTHHWEIVHYPVQDAAGDIVGICISTRDISERRQAAQRKLELEMEKERSRILTEFIQNASHEFRTPLSQIALDAYFLEMPGEEDRRIKYINSIKRQTATLGRLVERLVQTAELGEATALEQGPLNLNAVLERVIATYEPVASEKGLTIERGLDENLTDCVADEGRLLLAFSSLLDNAIRYTEVGQVTVRSRQQGERLLVEVADTGVGIRPEDLPRIFERFYREDQAHTTEGFGLGLSIAQRIVELHGGEIGVESERGRGSVFRVWLPAGAA